MTFRRTLARAFLPKAFLLALAFTWFAPTYLAPNWAPGTDEQVMAIRPHAEDSPPALVAAHDCWTGEAPADMAGVLPGHVVVTMNDHTRLGGSVLVGKALKQIFEGVDHGLAVHGFCR